MSEWINRLSELGALKLRLTKERALDLAWSLAGVDIYRLLCVDRGWDEHDYQRWLREVLAHELLEPTHMPT